MEQENYDYDEKIDMNDILEEYSSEENCGDEASMMTDIGEEGDEQPPFIAELDLHEGSPSYRLSVHPQNPNLVASAGENDKAVIFKCTDGESGLEAQIITELVGHTDTIEHISFSRDGSLLATGSLDGSVKVWKRNLNDEWTLLHTLEGPSEVTWIDWHPNGPVIAAGSADGTVWMWNASLGKCMTVFTGNSTTSLCGKFSTDGKILVSGGDGVIFVWNPKESTPSITYGGSGNNNFPTSDVISIAIHPVLPVAIAGFTDGTLMAVHLLHHQILSITQTSEESIEHVGFMQRAPVMVSAGLSGSIDIWDSNNYKSRACIKDEEMDSITAVRWLKSEGRMVVGCLNGNLMIWDVRSNEKICSWILGFEEDSIYDIVELPGLLLAAYDDGKIRIYRNLLS